MKDGTARRLLCVPPILEIESLGTRARSSLLSKPSSKENKMDVHDMHCNAISLGLRPVIPVLRSSFQVTLPSPIFYRP